MKFWLKLPELTNNERRGICKRIAITCWFIWKNRNAIVFKNKQYNMDLILTNACRLIKELKAMNPSKNMEELSREKEGCDPP